MKANILVTGTCSIILLATLGCGKQDSTTTPTTPPSPSASSATKGAPSAMGAAAGQATQTVATVKQAADKSATDTQKAAEKLAAGAAEASKLAESAIADVKKLIGEQKYQEALTAVQKTATMQLTPEQKKTVDDLLAQVQKLLAADPAKSAGGLLPKTN